MNSLAGGIIGLVILSVVFQDAFEVMLLPRRTQRRFRLAKIFFAVTWFAWRGIARQIPLGARRERFLSIYGPLAILLLFASWAALLITGFGLLEWSAQPRAAISALVSQLYMSGVTFFTLGYGDLVPHGPAARFIAVTEAGTGLGFIAAMIGYLPVLYQLFFQREAHVIQLDARAGSPPSAATMLRRHAESGGFDELDNLLREWEVWASELMESHLSYPMLAYYRSQHDNQSWLAALAAVMDTCALILVGVIDRPPLQARMTFTIARQVIVEMGRSFGTSPGALPLYERLPHETFVIMETMFAEAGLEWHGGPSAEAVLAALRATYEPLLESLSVRLLLPLPGWIPANDAADNWVRGHQGDLVSLLIDELSSRKAGSGDATAARETRWASLQQRLRRIEGLD